MFAPHRTTNVWHKVHPLDLRRAVCGTTRYLDANKASDDPPKDAEYCRVCARREHFVAALEHF
jgi:hypothetical protein